MVLQGHLVICFDVDEKPFGDCTYWDIIMLVVLFVTLVDCDETRWNSSKIISRLISLTILFCADPSITFCSIDLSRCFHSRIFSRPVLDFTLRHIGTFKQRHGDYLFVRMRLRSVEERPRGPAHWWRHNRCASWRHRHAASRYWCWWWFLYIKRRVAWVRSLTALMAVSAAVAEIVSTTVARRVRRISPVSRRWSQELATRSITTAIIAGRRQRYVESSVESIEWLYETVYNRRVE